MRKTINLIFIALILVTLSACNSSELRDLEESIDIADGVPRKPIDTNRMGLNAFGNDAAFGSACSQYDEVRNVLKLNHVRVLFNWNDGIQASADSQINFSFYDEIINCIPAGMQVLIVVEGLPSWMSDSANWINGNPRETFVRNWFMRVVRRYSKYSQVKALQVWNEPNIDLPANTVLDMRQNPSNYAEMLALAYSLTKDAAPRIKIVSAATTSIQQNFPSSLDYNKALKAAGAENFVDIWGVHFYGQQYEKVVVSGGVADFLNSISKPLWITESGQQGVNKQLEYVERAWPFLREKIPGIDLIYYYQHTSVADSNSAFGLKNTDAVAPVSDLYNYLRDR